MILDTVIDRIGTLFAATVAPVQVFDGPKPPSVNSNRYVLVGSEGDETGDAATVSLEPSDLGPGTWLDESGEITCSAWSWSGGTDIAARRGEALDLAESCVTALQGDRTLTGLLIAPGVVVSELRYLPVQFNTGPLVRVSFTVAYSHTNT
jgi:hypothetical protein